MFKINPAKLALYSSTSRHHNSQIPPASLYYYKSVGFQGDIYDMVTEQWRQVEVCVKLRISACWPGKVNNRGNF